MSLKLREYLESLEIEILSTWLKEFNPGADTTEKKTAIINQLIYDHYELTKIKYKTLSDDVDTSDEEDDEETFENEYTKYKAEYEVLFGCNGCENTIETHKLQERWCCNECPDFDICGDCYRKEMILQNGTDEEKHKLLIIDEYKPIKHYDSSPEPHLLTLEPLSQIELVKYLFGKSTFETMTKVFKHYSNRHCLGYREQIKIVNSDDGTITTKLSNEFKWFTYSQIYEKTLIMAKALTSFIKRRDLISINMDNCLEWYIFDFASLWSGLIVVPLHHNTSCSNLFEILSNSESTVIAVSNSTFKTLVELYESLSSSSSSSSSSSGNNDKLELIKIKLIINKDEFDQELVKKLPVGVICKTFNEMMEIGIAMNKPLYKFKRIKSNELSSIDYTSGSTGTPKGVMETESITNQLLLCFITFPNTTLSFHPLSHSQRLSDWRYLYMGGKIGIYSGSMDTLIDDLRLIRPHLFWAVPRFWNLLFTQYKSLFKQYQIDNPNSTNEQSKLECYKQIRSILGDRVKSLYTGSAPTSPEVLSFINDCWKDVNFAISYGLTEIAGVGINGKFPDGIDFKIEPVEKLGYSPFDLPNPRGELYVKSKTMSSGYYRNEQLTSESYIDGWFKTGDIVELVGVRTIKIIDRIKNAFKLANGEFVTPEPLGNSFSNLSHFIDQIFIYGNSYKTFLVAIIKPSDNCLKELNLFNTPRNELIENTLLKTTLLKELNVLGNQLKFANYEIPKIISIDFTVWTQENGLITGSGKFNRSELFKFYTNQINSMFDKMDNAQQNLRSISITDNNNSNQFKNYIKSILNLNNDYDDDSGGNDIEQHLDNLSFIQIGGDSLGAIKLSSYLKETENIDIDPTLLLNQNFNLSTLSQLINSNKEQSNPTTTTSLLLNELNENLKINWDNEMTLNQTIKDDIVKSLQQKGINQDYNIMESIFITGITGYLGTFLLSNLLNCDSVKKVYCLIRQNITNENEGFELIERIFEKANIKYSNKLIRDKIITIQGDLSKPLFGISNDTFTMLSNSINMVIHNGAMVNMAYPYINMKSINVSSTIDIIKLCVSGTIVKKLVYISTIGVFFGNELNDGCLIDESTIPSIKHLNHGNGYDQSKLISDILVREASSLGLPTMIFRPGTIFSHTETGYNNENDFIGLIIKGVLSSKSYPIKSDYNGGKLNLSPIDWVSNSIISLIKHLPYWSSSESKAQIFHLVNSIENIISFEQVFQFINESIPIEPISYSLWKDLQFNSTSNPLYSASSMFKGNDDYYFPVNDYRITNPQTIKYLNQIGSPSCNEITNSVIQKYVNYLISNNLINPINQ